MLLGSEPATWYLPSEKQALVLTVSSLPFDILIKLVRWEAFGDVEYCFTAGLVRDRVREFCEGVQVTDQLVSSCLQMLQRLVNAGRDGCSCGITAELEVLDVLRQCNLVVVDGSLWRLSADGQHTGAAGRPIRPVEKALRDRGLPLEENSTYELLAHLGSAGWQHIRVAKASQSDYPPYKVGDPLRFFHASPT